MHHRQALTEQEHQDWLEHPATLALKEYLRSEIELRKEEWMAGAYTDQSQFGTAIMNAKAIGFCEAATKILELTFDELESSDGK